MSKKIILLSLSFFAISFNANAGIIQLPQTGQAKCYDTNGTEITCASTKQDNDVKSDVASSLSRVTDKSDQAAQNIDVIFPHNMSVTLSTAMQTINGACSYDKSCGILDSVVVCQGCSTLYE